MVRARSVAFDPPSPSYDIDEWDPERGSLLGHAVAGSLAGVAEHSFMFPMDTIKTAMQTKGSIGSLQQHLSRYGLLRMWHGVQTMFCGCIPAHAAYFSIYEHLKPTLSTELNSPETGMGAAVAVASVAHDSIMTPLDVCKQRLQLGQYGNSMSSCAAGLYRNEGAIVFYRSLPVTIGMNVPYAFFSGYVNESLRGLLGGAEADRSLPVYLAAGGGAGAIAAGLTTPLDVIKTRLQTQGLEVPAMMETPAMNLATEGAMLRDQPLRTSAAPVIYNGVVQAFQAIMQEGGVLGFYRGAVPRMLTHAPAVAISWTSYETIKRIIEQTGVL